MYLYLTVLKGVSFSDRKHNYISVCQSFPLQADAYNMDNYPDYPSLYSSWHQRIHYPHLPVKIHTMRLLHYLNPLES